jgi:hypothetical protein
MGYGQETHTDYAVYRVTLNHNPSGNRVDLDFNPYRLDGAVIPESQRDNLFQGFLTHLSTLSNVSIVSASKNGKYTVPVTP